MNEDALKKLLRQSKVEVSEDFTDELLVQLDRELLRRTQRQLHWLLAALLGMILLVIGLGMRYATAFLGGLGIALDFSANPFLIGGALLLCMLLRYVWSLQSMYQRSLSS
ncbi:MAG: hypothetical protein AAF927_34525 [Bacteroidota bacterium]